MWSIWHTKQSFLSMGSDPAIDIHWPYLVNYKSCIDRIMPAVMVPSRSAGKSAEEQRYSDSIQSISILPNFPRLSVPTCILVLVLGSSSRIYTKLQLSWIAEESSGHVGVCWHNSVFDCKTLQSSRVSYLRLLCSQIKKKCIGTLCFCCTLGSCGYGIICRCALCLT